MGSTETKQFGPDISLLNLKQHTDGGFIITSPLMPELVAGGDTIEEALEDARGALGAVLACYQSKGKKISVSE